MTTPARPRAAKTTIRHATEIAVRVINGRRLPPGTTAGQLAAAFGKALAVTPPRSAHGRLLAAALQDRPPARRSRGERAAWWLACRGQTPTAQAVTGKLEEDQAIRERNEERKRTADMLAGRDGLRAAARVAGVVAGTGSGPTWRELGQAMGWPDGAAAAVIRRMVTAGWLADGAEPRSLRPGGRAS